MRNLHTFLRPLWRGCFLFACFQLAVLATGLAAYGSNREAVKKALAATVAVEWRAGGKADQPPHAEPPRATAAQRISESETEPTRQHVRAVLRLPAADSTLTLSSGVVLSPDGLVVAPGPEQSGGEFSISFDDGRSLPASILVDDRRTGLRLLKVDAHDLPYLELADAEAEIGDQVLAAFCTDRRERAVAQGIVSARLRAARWAISLQLDLAAGPMSAGGPLVDGTGRLVALVAGKAEERGPNNSATAATPLDAVRALLKARQGENTVVVQRGLLGLQLDGSPEGARERVVVHVMHDSPAESGGVREGDELVAVDGQKVGSPAEAAALVARHALGEKVAVTLRRDGAEKSMEITIGRPAPQAEAGSPANTELKALTGRLVHPEKLYVLTQDGKRVAVAATEQQLEPLRVHLHNLQKQAGSDGRWSITAEPAPHVIRVERSDLEKKLEDVGRNVESLQQQVEKLTAEIKALRAKLGEQP
jgi:S1-C subfamily serine protease